MTVRRVSVLAGVLFVLAAASCDSTQTTSATSGPCTWFTEAEVEQAIGIDVSPQGYDTDSETCSFQFFSRTGVNTDLVLFADMGPFSESDLESGRERIVVDGLGDRAVFYRAKTLDDGNSVMIVTKGDRTFHFAGEFLTLAAAERLGELALRD